MYLKPVRRDPRKTASSGQLVGVGVSVDVDFVAGAATVLHFFEGSCSLCGCVASGKDVYVFFSQT
jgi:hypothetical protein